MCLNHSKTIPTYLVQGKTVSHETSPWSQKGWGLLLYSSFDHSLNIQVLVLPTTCEVEII